MNEITLLVITTIGGFLLGGVRNAIGRWIFNKACAILKKIFIKSERDMATYLHARNEKRRQLKASSSVHE